MSNLPIIYACGWESKTGEQRTEIVKEQIRATVEAHFQKQVQVEGRGIKVLSLFFIDKVENYRIHHDTGFELGQYAKWFEEIYNGSIRRI